MKEKSFFKNILTVVGGNGMYLLANILLGFLLPMILDVRDYGYYKIYTLYVGYCGLLNFGFPDGILLRYGGWDYARLDKPLMRAYSRFFLVMQAVMTLVVVGISAFLQKEYTVIIGFVGLNLLWYNVTLYYQYLSQATSRFKEFSLRKTLQAAGTIAVLLVFLLGKRFGLFEKVSYVTFILLMQGISLALLGWYIFTYRDITFGRAVGLRQMLPELKPVFRKGLMLTVAYEVAQLILLMDRQFVSVLFDVQTYAQYAFAYNILSCITALITAISTVMFPMLKKDTRQEALEKFQPAMTAVVCLVGLCLVGLYPVDWLIGWILPRYVQSLTYVKIIFPTLLFTSGITIIAFTYYKVLDQIRNYLFICLGVLAVAFGGNCVAAFVWKTPAAVSWASVVATSLWFVVVVGYLGRKFRLKWVKSLLYILVISAAFYATAFLDLTDWLRIALYLAAYLLATGLFYGKQLLHLMKHKHTDKP